MKYYIYPRRMGYAEREGEAILRKKRAQQMKREAIGVSIAGGIAITFFWFCFYLWNTGQTPLFK